MKTFNKLALAASVALSFSANAATISNADGLFSPFGGFDWASNGAAAITNFNLSTTSAAGSIDPLVTLQYIAYAAQVTDSAGNNFITPNLVTGNSAPGYEYTIFANLQETATCSGIGGTAANPCGALALSVTSGTFDIYYHTAPNATIATGLGFIDGTPIISGSITPGFAGFFSATGDAPGGSGFGSNTLTGTVTTTNNTFVNPNLTGTTVTTTLQYGAFQTNFTRPSSINGVSTGAADTASSFVFQADSNQSFNVPEPGSLALIAIALLGFGFNSRRKHY